ncbi:FAD-binding oxidoreductase [Prauserella cavernicola]|uniref:FAD-binding oxidoreductase n=1 Tax=Prauserella cavernicola TaxID=2800127 RepID=A0A934V3F8_9PSEU|nr:FAD-binding oxidoreductase [Prauserella cavernicola]MBK1784302.1 FAD-binding oxidoreductase [Prauserella cavernicola]
MTQTVGGGVAGLQALLSGTVLGPEHAEYDQARRVWNADIDRRPAMIARCVSADDVAAAVTFARAQDLEIAVRGGAHSSSGASAVDDGLVIDTSALNDVTVDTRTKRVRVGGGALLGDVDAVTQQHGLAVPSGIVSHTGVAGLTLGGGMGWLTPRAGLTIDHLVSAEIVTADGRIRRVSDDEYPDLFWAIRGGGGNFGIVTEFEFALHEAGPIVHVGMLFWDLELGRDVLRLARELIAEGSRDVNIVVAGLNAPPEPFVPPEHHFTPGYAFLVVGFSGEAEHADVMERARRAVPPLFEFADAMPYTGLQSMLDEGNGWGVFCYEKSAYLDGLTDDVIDVVTDFVPQKTSPQSAVLFYRLDGAYSEVAEDATAFGGDRRPRLAVFCNAITGTAEQLPAEREWARRFLTSLGPHTANLGGYLNAMSDLRHDSVLATYGQEKYDRLSRVKHKYDPDNVFHRNVNITPQA